MAAATPVAPTPASRIARPDRPLFVAGVGLVLVIVFAGFARTFYLKASFGAPPLSNLLLLHGLVMTSWIGLFIAQTLLVETGNVRLHRRLGVAGGVIATLVLAVGAAAAIDAGRRGFSPSSQIAPQVFMAIPLIEVLMFGLLVGVALLNRHNAATHKRLMLLATVGIMTPAIARLPIEPWKALGVPAFFAATIACMLLLVAIDTVRHRKLHPAFGWGAALWIASVPARFLIGQSEAWRSFADRLIALAG